MLDTRSLSGFEGGVYLSWTIRGDVTITLVNNTRGLNSVASGLFFGA